MEATADKSMFNNIDGCRHSLTYGSIWAIDSMVGGKRELVCGYSELAVIKGYAFAWMGVGACVLVADIDTQAARCSDA